MDDNQQQQQPQNELSMPAQCQTQERLASLTPTHEFPFTDSPNFLSGQRRLAGFEESLDTNWSDLD